MTSLEALRLDRLVKEAVNAAIEVHRKLGPGLLESAYEACLAHELIQRGYKVERQKPLPLIYKGVTVDCGYRIDMLVNDGLVLELKAVDALSKVHEAQLLSYLRLSGCRLGLLINFNVTLLKHGLKRMVHMFPDASMLKGTP